MASADLNISKKKRASERQLNKDIADDANDNQEQVEPGSFAKASENVLAERRIVKVRRSGLSVASSSMGSAPTEPFSGLPRSSQSMRGDSGFKGLLAGGAVAELDGFGKNTSKGLLSVGGEKPAEDEGKVMRVGVAHGLSQGETTARGAIEESMEVNRASAEFEDEGEKLGSNDSASEQDQSFIKVSKLSGEPETSLRADGVTNMPEQREDRKSYEVEEHCKTKDTAEEAHRLKDTVGCASGFAGLSSGTNAFSTPFEASFSMPGSGLVGTESAFSASPAFQDFSFGGGLTFGAVTREAALPTLSSVFGESKDGALQPVGGKAGATGTACSAAFGLAQPSTACLSEVAVETGEEEESPIFSTDATLYEFAEGATWKERGKGELRLNVPHVAGRKARLIMRAKGNLRLLLNAYLFPDMKLTRMDGVGLRVLSAEDRSLLLRWRCSWSLKLSIEHSYLFVGDKWSNQPAAYDVEIEGIRAVNLRLDRGDSISGRDRVDVLARKVTAAINFHLQNLSSARYKATKRYTGRGVTFACVNSSGAMASQVRTCALKFKDASTVDSFTNAVECQKRRSLSK